MQAEPSEQDRQYDLVARAITFIRTCAQAQPSLEQVAQAVHVSPFHLQRVFAEWAGLSPKRFLQYLTKQHAKQQLLESMDVLRVTHASGLSSTSRLHDLMVTCEAMTPGEIKTGGSGLAIGYGFSGSPFGEVLVAWTSRGICHFAFSIAHHETMRNEMFAYWPKAHFLQDDDQAKQLLQNVFPTTPTRGKVHLLLRGTNFQIKVWEALIHTDFGRVTSYQRLAERAGIPKAQRAVGTAMAANHIGFLIPCHRVIRESGEIGHYRWGSERKQAMLAWELARSAND